MKRIENDILEKYLADKIENMNDDVLAELSGFFNSSPGRYMIQTSKREDILYRFVQAALLESRENRDRLYLIMESYDKMQQTDFFVRRILYRINSDNIDEETGLELIDYLDTGGSVYLFLIYAGFFLAENENAIIKFSTVLRNVNLVKYELLFLNAANRMYPENQIIAVKLAECFMGMGMQTEAEKVLKSYISAKEGTNIG